MQKQKEIGPFCRGDAEKREDPLQRCLRGSRQQHSSLLQRHCRGLYIAFFLVIYSLFLKLFWESVNTEPGSGASPLGSSRSGQDPAPGSLGLAEAGGRGGGADPYPAAAQRGKQKQPFPSLPPTAPARQ